MTQFDYCVFLPRFMDTVGRRIVTCFVSKSGLCPDHERYHWAYGQATLLQGPHKKPCNGWQNGVSRPANWNLEVQVGGGGHLLSCERLLLWKIVSKSSPKPAPHPIPNPGPCPFNPIMVLEYPSTCTLPGPKSYCEWPPQSYSHIASWTPKCLSADADARS